MRDKCICSKSQKGKNSWWVNTLDSRSFVWKGSPFKFKFDSLIIIKMSHSINNEHLKILLGLAAISYGAVKIFRLYEIQ